jgi:hypothetical protein
MGLPDTASFRSKLAKDCGMPNYTGTAEQNAELLRRLRRPVLSPLSPVAQLRAWLSQLLSRRGH